MMSWVLILFVIAVILFVVAAVLSTTTPGRFGWLGLSILTIAFALTSAGVR